MSDEEKQISMNDVLFIALVRDFESMAMVGFGKLVDPATQKAERNLDRAKVAIDMLGMLEEKTKGNLNETQAALMRQVLTNLRLNYVDELEKGKAEREREGEREEEAEAAASSVAGGAKTEKQHDQGRPEAAVGEPGPKMPTGDDVGDTSKDDTTVAEASPEGKARGRANESEGERTSNKKGKGRRTGSKRKGSGVGSGRKPSSSS